MSYTVVPAAPKQRPPVVAAASALLVVVAVVALASLAASLASIGPTRDAYLRIYSDTTPESAETMATGFLVGIVITVALALAMAVGYLVLALFVARGKNPARIVTWVIAGLVVLCSSCGLAGDLASSAVLGGVSGTPNAGAPDPQQVASEVEAALPGWISVASMVSTVLTVVCLLAVSILLTLPAANAFFGKETEVWLPPGAPGPVPGYPQGSGYPGYPQGSGYPGYPQGSGYPGYPQSSGYPHGPEQPPAGGGPGSGWQS